MRAAGSCAAMRDARNDCAHDSEDAARRAGRQQWAPGHQLPRLSSLHLLSSGRTTTSLAVPQPPRRPPGERAEAVIGSSRHSTRRLSSAAAPVTLLSCFHVTLPSKAAGRRLQDAGCGASTSAPCLLAASPCSSSCARATLVVPGDSALLAPAAAATASAKAPGHTRLLVRDKHRRMRACSVAAPDELTQSAKQQKHCYGMI